MRACPLLAVGAAAAVLIAADATGQEGCPPAPPVYDHVNRQDSTYDAARDSAQRVFDEWRRLEDNWNELLDEGDRLRAAGDDAALKRNRAQLQELTEPRDRIISARRALEERWLRAGDDLVSQLDAYLEILNDATPNQALIDEFSCWSRRLREVEDQLEAQRGPRAQELTPMPEVRALPGDSPETLMTKARLLERLADRDDKLVEDVEKDIEALVRRERRDRSHRDFIVRAQADMNLPVGAGTDQSGVVSSDTTATLTTEQRIELLESFRDAAATRRDQLRERARELRERAGGAA